MSIPVVSFAKATLLCLLLTQLSRAQNYIAPPKNFVKMYYKGYQKYVFPKDAYYLEKSLPVNANKEAKIDYTEKLQQAINKYPVVIMPNFPVLINSKGLLIPSDRIIYFNQYSMIKFKGPALERLNDIIKIYDVSNVKIYNANIIGSRREKSNQKGEWSAGICVLNSSNVEINNFQIKDTWGDGIFIGSENGKVSSNIVVKNGFIDFARRDGVSITSADNLDIDYVFISNTYGTLPMSGIQIEPSLYSEIIQNVKLKNIYTYNNPGGLIINLQSFSAKSGLNKKEVSVNVKNFTDEGSNYSFGTSISNDDLTQNPIGKIMITNAVWKNPKKDFYWRNSNAYDINIVLDKINKYKNNKLISTED
ncbi:hypothetical protein [Flavobacterium polysaccharolyticum]|uniref:Right handed beta helix region n=1 Tax=Flavobacterium polysaccharolyticum TaxID=3133148 RepID=A0ABU9NKS3_9FLAO